jgi:hypothetical protein
MYGETSCVVFFPQTTHFTLKLVFGLGYFISYRLLFLCVLNCVCCFFAVTIPVPLHDLHSSVVVHHPHSVSINPSTQSKQHFFGLILAILLSSPLFVNVMFLSFVCDPETIGYLVAVVPVSMDVFCFCSDVISESSCYLYALSFRHSSSSFVCVESVVAVFADVLF